MNLSINDKCVPRAVQDTLGLFIRVGAGGFQGTKLKKTKTHAQFTLKLQKLLNST